MKHMVNEYKAMFKKIFSEYKLLTFMLLAICLLSYGFTITHHSIGVDNNAHELYYMNLGVLSLGRLTPLLLDKIFGAYQYTPFWSNGLSIIVLYFSILFWCMLFIKLSKERIAQGALIIFSLVLASYPIINEHFIFNPLNYALSYGLTAISLNLVYDALIRKKFGLGAAAVILMFFVISLNESFAAVYLCGICFILILNFLYRDESLPKRFSLTFIGLSLGVLFLAVVSEFLVLKVINSVLSARPEVGAANQNIFWFTAPLTVTIKNLFLGMIYKYGIMGKYYFPITVFVLSGFISLILAVYLAIKRKKPIILLWMGLLYLSVVALSLIKGVVLPYRTSSTLGIFAAFIMMMVWMIINKKWMKIVYGVLMVILIINQTRVLSSWFVNDYSRYLKDKEVAIKVSKEIERSVDETKPVVFLGWINTPSNIKQIDGEYNGVSFISNYTDKRESRNQFYYLLHDFFEIQGHRFPFASEAQYLSAREIAKNMPSYPKDGYIRETDDYIIVNFN